MRPTDVREHNAEDEELLKQTLIEVERYRKMDRLIPSPHNIVTIAALEVRRHIHRGSLAHFYSQFNLLLSTANLISSKLKEYFPLTR